MSKRTDLVLLRGAWLLALVALSCKSHVPPAAAPSGNEPRAERVLKIGYQKIGVPFLLKERAQTLQKQLAERHTRLEWVEFQAGPPVLEAMRAGAVDIGYVGETPPVFAQAGGVPFVYVATDAPAPLSEAILVPKDSKLTKVAELKGKHIALNRGSNVHYLLVRALEEAGLTLSDVQVTYLAPPDARSAFEGGQLDAWVIWDPFQAAAEIKGARVLRDGGDLLDNRFFYVARRELATAEPELLRTVLGELERLTAWARTRPEEVAQILSKSSGIAYEALLLAEKRHTYRIEPITKDVLAKQQRIADTFSQLQLIPKPIQLNDVYLAQVAYGSGS